MATTNPRVFHQSASSIASFKACPTRYRLSYREGLRTAEDTESQRVGTNWHKIHEVYHEALHQPYALPHDPAEQLALQAVVSHLSERYASCPPSKDLKDWALERQILLTCFVGYLWFWQNDPIEVLASEIPFELPLHVPGLGLPLPTTEVMRVGKIDHIVKWHGMVGTIERKSTSRSILPDSDYWEKSQKDTQVSMYALAFRELIATGQLAHLGPLPLQEGESMPNIGSTLYDVWHKPTIKPSMLTQKETAEFITTGEYCGQKFEVEQGEDILTDLRINGTNAEIEPGKKGFAIRETVEMFGAVYQTMRQMDKTGHWFENESACRATFPCAYIKICYGPGADAVCDGTTTPDGYKRIFVDLKVNGQSTEE